MIYMDYNATSPLRPEALAAANEALTWVGNPSAVHSLGRFVRKQIEAARTTLAGLIETKPSALVFTSCGSESNNHVLSSHQETLTLVCATEHDSILNAREGLVAVPVDHDGIVDISFIDAALRTRACPALISIQLANNETGVIQPIADITRIASKYGALVHTDAVQAFGRIPVSFSALAVDFMTLSAHKIGGGYGAGALVIRDGLRIPSFIRGGFQESGRRAGTENVPAIAAFARAAHAAVSESKGPIQALRDTLEAELKATAPDMAIHGAQADRLPNTSCFSTPRLNQESQLMALDLEGIAVSAGAACASKKIRPSHVLSAMGASPDDAKTALRVSLGFQSKPDHIKAFLKVWRTLNARIQSRHVATPSTLGEEKRTAK